jgi:UDP-N-acetylmuramyl tripeptide synthase
VSEKANPVVTTLGKAVQGLAGLRGGGSALPGLVVETIDRDFAVRLLAGLPYGVAVISGTNGKTTTTKIVHDLLTSVGLRVFTNDSGSNFMRGVISSLLRSLTPDGRLKADIAVLELDEAHAVDFARRVRPRYTLLLNVMRDQLDRFGEIDHTASLLVEVARNTTDTLVLNREDRRVAAIASCPGINAALRWYGLAPQLLRHFPADDELYAGSDAEETGRAAASDPPEPVSISAAPLPTTSDSPAATRPAAASDTSACAPAADVVLAAFAHGKASYEIAGVTHTTDLALKGAYNAYNAAAALALARAILAAAAPSPSAAPLAAAPSAVVSDAQLLATLATITSAFGRGEEFQVGPTRVELILVKNPGGFRLALESFRPVEYLTMIAINDGYADGRDISWLYDVSFVSLRSSGVAMVSGTRAFDMALRLHYDGVRFSAIQTNLVQALDGFLVERPERPHRIYCTYTAMLALRRHLLAGMQSSLPESHHLPKGPRG